MIFIPWRLIALVISWVVVAVFTYEHCQADFDKERNDAKIAFEEQNARTEATNADWKDKHDKVSAQLASTQAKLQDAGKKLDVALAAGTVRLSVAGSCSSKLPNDSASPAGDNPARCDIDPTAAQRIVAITERGDEAINKLNACIDAYEGLLK